MKKEIHYVLSTNIDKTMNNVVRKIKQEIAVGSYDIKDFDSFIESAILVFDKMMKNHISPFIFDSFIKAYKKPETDPVNLDA